MLDNDEQLLNAKSPMLITLPEIVTLVNDEQPPKALLPILVTLLGIEIFINDLRI